MILPQPPTDEADIPQYLAKLVPILQQYFNDPEVDSITLTKTHEAPERVEEGMVVYADGTDWNPGSGEGIYKYQSGAWSLI